MSKNISLIIIVLLAVAVLFYLGLVLTKPSEVVDIGTISDLSQQTASDSTESINADLNIDLDAGVDSDLDSIDQDINTL